MNRKINFLKKLDALVGSASVRIIRILIKPKKRRSNQIDSILFIRPGGIGDAVLLLPAIKKLKERFPASIVTVLCEKRNADIFYLSEVVDKVLRYDKMTELYSAIQGSHDMVIDTEQWYRLSAVIAYLTGAPVRIGFATNERKLLFSQSVPYDQDKYELESFFDLIEGFVENSSPEGGAFLSVPENDNKKADSLLQAFPGKKIVVLFPGGSIAEKKWSVRKFHDLSGLLVDKGYGLVVIGGPADSVDCSAIAEDIKGSINVCGSLSLSETSAVLSRASLLITGDSGIMHIASALGTSTLALFGPGNEKKWAPKGGSHFVIRKNLDCSPCSRFGTVPKCPRHIECMEYIEVDEVFNKAVELLKRK